MGKEQEYLGEYHYKVEPYGRIRLPIRLRQHYANGLAILYSSDRCLMLYPQTETPEEARAIITKPDGRGRVTLSRELREYADIEDSAVFLVVGGYAQLWGERPWQEELEREKREANGEHAQSDCK